MVTPDPGDGAGNRAEDEVGAERAQGQRGVGGGAAHRGVVGEGGDGHVLGHLDEGHVRVAILAHDAGALEPAVGADDREVLEPAQGVRRGDDEPPSATAMPISITRPCEVVAWSSTMERPAARATAGTAFCNPGRVETEAATLVFAGPPVGGWSEAGESRTTRKHGDGGDGGRPDEDHEGGAVTLARRRVQEDGPGLRAGRDLARVAPEPVVGVDPSPERAVRVVAAAALAATGSPSMGSSGVSLTWSRLPRSALVARSRHGPGRTMRPHVPRPGHRSRDGQHAGLREGKGLVLNEPTVVALDSRSRDVLAIGTDAWQMIGRTPATSWRSARCAAAPSPTSR